MVRARPGRFRSHSVTLLILLLLLIGLGAAACGGGDEDKADQPLRTDNIEASGTVGTEAEEAAPAEEPAPAEDAAPAEEPAPAEEAAPAEDRTFTMAVTTSIESVQPGDFQGAPSWELQPIWSSPLLRMLEPEEDRLPAPGEVEGFIAEVPDGRNDDGGYTITLKDTSSFYGNPVTSEDVKWSLARAIELDPITGFLFGLGKIDFENPVTIVDEGTFNINVTGPSAYTLAVLSWYGGNILDSVEVQQHVTDEDPWAEEWLQRNTASFAPYHVESFIPAEEVRLVANDGWWAGPTDIQSVVIRAVPDPSIRFELIASGETDYVNFVTFDQFNTLAEDPSVKERDDVSVVIDVLALQIATEPFDDVRVRRAISMAIDREALVEGVYKGRGKPAYYMEVEAMALPEPLPPPVVYDPEAALELLAEAGYPDGFSFTLSACPCRPGPWAEDVAVAIKDQLKDIGIDVSVQVIASSPDFEQDKSEKKFEAWVDDSTPIIADLAYEGLLVYHSTGGLINFHSYDNARVNELIDLSLATAEGPERDDLIRELHDITQEEIPWVTLVERVSGEATGQNIGNYSVDPMTRSLRVYDLTLGE